MTGPRLESCWLSLEGADGADGGVGLGWVGWTLGVGPLQQLQASSSLQLLLLLQLDATPPRPTSPFPHRKSRPADRGTLPARPTPCVAPCESDLALEPGNPASPDPCECCTHRDGTSHFVRAGGGRHHHPHARTQRHTHRAVPSSSEIFLRRLGQAGVAQDARGAALIVEIEDIGCASYRASKAGAGTGFAATCFAVLPASFFHRPAPRVAVCRCRLCCL